MYAHTPFSRARALSSLCLCVCMCVCVGGFISLSLFLSVCVGAGECHYLLKCSKESKLIAIPELEWCVLLLLCRLSACLDAYSLSACLDAYGVCCWLHAGTTNNIYAEVVCNRCNVSLPFLPTNNVIYSDEHVLALASVGMRTGSS